MCQIASVRLWSFFFGGSTLVIIVVEVGLDLLVELVQSKEEKVIYSFCRAKLENLIIIPAAYLLILIHVN